MAVIVLLFKKMVIFTPRIAAASGTYYTRFNTTTGEIAYLTSSARYKDNIATFTDDWAKILQARPVTYTDKSDGTHQLGFIAEEFDALALND